MSLKKILSVLFLIAAVIAVLNAATQTVSAQTADLDTDSISVTDSEGTAIDSDGEDNGSRHGFLRAMLLVIGTTLIMSVLGYFMFGLYGEEKTG